jgi:serine/threonine protein kinase
MSTGDFLVGQVVGEGRFSTVFHGRCKHHRDDVGRHRSVAIKVIEKVSVNKHAGIRRAVLQEQKLLRRLTETTGSDCHSSALRRAFVVPLVASFHDSQLLYLVLECARGTLADAIREHGKASDDAHQPPSSLATFLREPPSSWVRTAACLAYQTLEAMEYIHTNGVIHCDIKPDNLLLSEQGRVQLCDFGSAIDTTSVEPTTDPESWNATVPRGTPEYASPEMLRGTEGISFETDLWSFGCVLFALLEGGESPFHAQTESLAVERIMTSNVNANEIPSSRLPPLWKKLIYVLLQREPRRRWVDSSLDVYLHGTIDSGARRQATLSDRYASMKKHPIWVGIDGLDQHLPPDLLSDTSARLNETIETMRDGNLGWTAFAF